jgi:hypothetical protein
LDIELCHKKHELAEYEYLTNAQNLVWVIQNQTHNHTEVVGELSETIQVLTEQLTTAEAELKALRKMNRLTTALLVILWIFVISYGIKKLCKWMSEYVPRKFAEWGAAVDERWNRAATWCMWIGWYLRFICITIANAIVWVGVCLEAMCYATARGLAYVGRTLVSITVGAGKLIGRIFLSLAYWAKCILMRLIYPALIMTPLVLFRDHIPGLENIEFPTTWIDAVLLAIKGFDWTFPIEIAVRMWAKQWEEEAEEGLA